MPPKRFYVKPSTVLSLLTFLTMLGYYFRGLNSVPQPVLLPIAGQVLAVGINSLSTFFFSILVRISTRRALPLDVITPFMIDLNTQFGGFLTPERFLLAPIINLLFLHTPETLLGALAADKSDIRSVNSIIKTVELGPFGGAYNTDAYYLSGQLLLSSTNPDADYKQVAYSTSLGWVLPRKPVPWYEVFARTLSRDNDAEKRIEVPNNDAAILVPVSVLPQPCNKRNISDFDHWLTFHHCGSYIGFSFGGNLPETHGFYRFHRGMVAATYASWNGNRFVDGSAPSSMEPATFPRPEGLWESMSFCFLNSISFNRPQASISWIDRLAISSVVRIADFESPSGFSTPPTETTALVSDTVNSNISRWVLVSMALSVLCSIIEMVLSMSRFELLAPELETLVASLREVEGLTSVSRFVRKRRDWFRRIWATFQTDPDGGGRWIIPGGLNGGEELDENKIPDAEAEADTDGTSSNGSH